MPTPDARNEELEPDAPEETDSAQPVDPDEEDLGPDPDEEDPDSEETGRPAKPRGTAQEPAWRARLRQSSFGQVAVLLVAAFAIAIATWWVVGPDEDEDRAQAAAVSRVEVDGVATAPVVGDTAPAFTATDLNSQPVDLQALRGKPVWVMFVATWCTGCRTEMPDVQAAAAKHGEDIEVIAIYVGESATTVKPYSERVGLTFTQVADHSNDVAAAYGVMGVPAHYFIDANGVIRHTQVGLLSPAQMEERITAVSAAT